MGDSQVRLEKLENIVEAMGIEMKMMKKQIGQIATTMGNQHQQGQSSSQTTINHKEQCKAIYIRSGTFYKGPKVQLAAVQLEKEAEDEVEQSETIVPPTPPAPPSKPVPTPTVSPSVAIPFPQRLLKKKLDDQFSKFLEVFRKVHINIPFIEALQKMPKYAKFLKDVISNKKKFESYEMIHLAENCSALIQRKLPPKKKDPGSFTILCAIDGKHGITALCDLGASVNLMPLSFFQKLGIGELKSTTISLQMADRTVTIPREIVEDVLVKVNDFIFPMDFVVLDMEEDKDVPLILGRPFLNTARALIDVERSEITFRVNDESIIYKLHERMCSYDGEESKKVEECKELEIMNLCTNLEVFHTPNDPFRAKPVSSC